MVRISGIHINISPLDFQQEDMMNKRIRKKHLKRALNGLLAAYDEYEAARERVFRKRCKM